ncbi:MAG TPA: DUF1349 domain-containing protein [Streptosporangiaceae bacterium]|nr:DUF1349 domain-containing protein [Streptosporangiaceae bacterium]
MQWLNEPASWQRTGEVLRVSVDPGTDFWRATGYGYIHDNGHVYGELLPGDLDVSVRVRGTFASQYDQAGIMLRADEQTWLKTGVEFFEGRPRLSTVLTLGWSSWIVADLPAGTDEVTLRVSRRGEAVEVRYTAGSGPAELAALVFLPPGRELLAGIGCAAPEGTGFTVNFHDLRIVGRDWVAAGSGDWANGEVSTPAADWPEEPAASPAEWSRSGPGEVPASWAQGEPGDAGPPWAAAPAGEADPGWGAATASEPAAEWAEPASEPAAEWAEPLASEAAEDWEQLSLRVSASWKRGREQEPPPAETAAEPAPAGPADGDTTGQQAAVAAAGDTTSTAPEPLADDKTDPAMPTASGDEAGPASQQPAGTDRAAGARPGGKPGGKGSGRGKAKPPAPPRPAASEPADAADEWISLLTADPAEE